MADELVFEATRLSSDGRGLAFAAQGRRRMAVFITGALPGQTAVCRIVKRQKNFLEAEATSLIAQNFVSPEPLCPHLGECGGCPLQLLPRQSQLYWKERFARDAIQRIGGIAGAEIDAAWRGIAPSPQARAFRNKIELAFGKSASGDFALGFRGRASRNVFQLKNCALVDEEANAIAVNCRRLALETGLPVYDGDSGFFRRLILRKAGSRQCPKPRWHALLLTSPASKKQRGIVAGLGARLLETSPSPQSFIHEERKSRDMLAGGEKRILTLSDAPIDLAIELGGRLFEIDATSFFQVNGAAGERLANLVKDFDSLAKPGPLLDVYCGVGAPGQLLSANHDSALGIEIDKKAILRARRNAADLPAWRYECGDAGRKLKAFANRKGLTVLLDPPRAGLDKTALAALMELNPENILYISCNPASMARDARVLASARRLAGFAAIDMFPHTPHVECVALWQRKDSSS